jgi:N-acetylneuraminic acid mutarotase
MRIAPIVTPLEERALLSQLPGTWATVAPLPNYPAGTWDIVEAAADTNGLIYALGGGTTVTDATEMDAYNPSTNAWSVVANVPRKTQAVTAAPNGLIYSISAGTSGEVDAYNPATNTWAAVATEPGMHRGGAAVTGTDGRIYVLGGIAWNGGTDSNGNPIGVPSNEVDAYNPATNCWTVLANLPGARVSEAAAVGLDGRIYAIGGFSTEPPTPSSEVVVYTPATNSWAVLPSLPTARGALAAATGPDGRIYAIGGGSNYVNCSYYSEVDAYSPSTNSWTVLNNSLPSAREALGAASGSDGRIYAIGGDLGSSYSASSEVDAYFPPTPYVQKVTPIVTWSGPGNIVYGTPLGPNQLDATASVPGSFIYSPAAGTVLNAGAGLTLSATFIPTDTADFNSVYGITTSINVTPAPTSTSLGASPGSLTYGLSEVLTATVGTNPPGGMTPTGGTVTFMDGPTTLGSVTLTNGTAQFSTTRLGAGAHTLRAVYSGDGINFSGGSTPSGLSVAVTPAVLTVTASSATDVYGAALPPLAYTIGGFVNGDNAGVVSGSPWLSTTATASSHVSGGPYAITIGAGTLWAANYSFNLVGGDLSITPAPLTIAANNATKVYGAALPPLTASYWGLVNGDSAASLATPPVLTTTAWAGSPVLPGGYAVIASGAGDPDYTISYQPGTLLVTPAPLMITANNASKLQGAAVPPLTARYSGFINGDSPASLAVRPTVTTPATSRSPAGTYPIVVGGASSPNYAINYANGILVVTPAPVRVLKVSVEAIRLGNNTKTTQVIVMQFSGALNPGDAQTTRNYTLTTIPANKGQKGQSVALSQARYNAKTNTVTLITRQPLILSPPIRLTMNLARLLDRYGRPLSGKSVATFSKGRVTF